MYYVQNIANIKHNSTVLAASQVFIKLVHH